MRYTFKDALAKKIMAEDIVDFVGNVPPDILVSTLLWVAVENFEKIQLELCTFNIALMGE